MTFERKKSLARHFWLRGLRFALIVPILLFHDLNSFDIPAVVAVALHIGISVLTKLNDLPVPFWEIGKKPLHKVLGEHILYILGWVGQIDNAVVLSLAIDSSLETV